MRDIADDMETGLDLLAVVAFVGTERMIADIRMRNEILAHNRRVAAVRAQRARKRAEQAALGQELLAGWLADREQLH